MLRRASRNPVATSTKGIACGNRVGVKRRRLLLRDLSDLPSPFTFVRSSHLPAVGAGKHTCAHIFFSSQISFRHVSIAIPPIFFCLSRIGNTFPKRVLIRKKPYSAFTVQPTAAGCRPGAPAWSPRCSARHGDVARRHSPRQPCAFHAPAPTRPGARTCAP